MGYGESFMRRFYLCGFTRMHDPDGVSYSPSEDVLANSFYQCYWNERCSGLRLRCRCLVSRAHYGPSRRVYGSCSITWQCTPGRIRLRSRIREQSSPRQMPRITLVSSATAGKGSSGEDSSPRFRTGYLLSSDSYKVTNGSQRWMLLTS